MEERREVLTLVVMRRGILLPFGVSADFVAARCAGSPRNSMLQKTTKRLETTALLASFPSMKLIITPQKSRLGGSRVQSTGCACRAERKVEAEVAIFASTCPNQ
jgi:hypothetical protein